YTSPLAAMYGKLEADPVVDERYTQKDSLFQRLKELVEGSYSISVTITMEDLRQAGYQYGFPEPGDYLLAVNETLQFKQKIRIVSVDEDFDSLGHSIGHTVTCNSLNLVD
ncbi:phage tail protein, partial [Enterococcus faecalis]|uniref:phage tail protein n=1 Tax=Enterococcus faecalis TaxID=1351 RepID=UPI003D0E5A93